jgi:hypothetical protein
MNVIGHQHASANSDTEVGGAAAVFDEACVNFGDGEQIGSSMGIEGHEIKWRSEAFKD